LGFIGGNLSIVLSLTGFFVIPFGLIEFVIDKSSKKEEIEMQIG